VPGGHGVDHYELAGELLLAASAAEDEPVAAAVYSPVVLEVGLAAPPVPPEAGGREPVRRLLGREEEAAAHDEAVERRRPAVERAESADEPRVGDEAAPALAHEAHARERRGLRWETEEELRQKVVVLQRRRRRRRGGLELEAFHRVGLGFGPPAWANKYKFAPPCLYEASTAS